LRRPSLERTLYTLLDILVEKSGIDLVRVVGQMWRRRTERSFRGWRMKRSTGASGTSWGRCTRRKRRRQRYHLKSSNFVLASDSSLVVPVPLCKLLLVPILFKIPPLMIPSKQIYASRVVNKPERKDVRMAADSTMLRMVNLLIALSLGVQREQLLQRTGLT
jgi:hypothetical protein